MIPVVAMTRPPIVAATTDTGIIILVSSPSWVSASVIISGLGLGTSSVDELVCMGGGCAVELGGGVGGGTVGSVVGPVGGGGDCLVDWVENVSDVVDSVFVSGEEVSVDSEKRNSYVYIFK